jgi:predicted small secreted protein
MRYGKILVVVAVLAPLLAACATPQGMTVAGGAVVNPVAKYRNAIAVRSVSGGQAMNILTVPGVPNEPFKAALESTLAANGYLAQSGTPKFYLDAEILNLDQPLIGLTLDVVADVTY